VPTVCFHVAAKRRDLVHPIGAIQHANGPELDADRHRALEQTADLRRRGSRRQIPIEVHLAEERIAHGTADAPGFEAGLLQCAGDLDDLAGST
jgi:hypothetical protein